jgi:hypothetical protein
MWRIFIGRQADKERQIAIGRYSGLEIREGIRRADY